MSVLIDPPWPYANGRACAALFASCPPWLSLGWRHGRR